MHGLYRAESYKVASRDSIPENTVDDLLTTTINTLLRSHITRPINVPISIRVDDEQKGKLQ